MTRTSGSFESVWWNACLHRLGFGLYSLLKELRVAGRAAVQGLVSYWHAKCVNHPSYLQTRSALLYVFCICFNLHKEREGGSRKERRALCVIDREERGGESWVHLARVTARGVTPENRAKALQTHLLHSLIMIIIMMVIIIIMMIVTIIIIMIIMMMIIALKGAFWEVLQSPHCVTNCLQRVWSGGLGTIVCKSCATNQALITCYMSCAMYEGTAQLLRLTEFKSPLF